MQRLVSWPDPLASKELRIISGVLLSPPRCVVYLYESALGHEAETRGDVEDAAKRAEAAQLLEDGGTDCGLGGQPATGRARRPPDGRVALN